MANTRPKLPPMRRCFVTKNWLWKEADSRSRKQIKLLKRKGLWKRPTIKNAIEAEMQTAEQAIKQEAPEDVLTSSQGQQRKIEQQYKLPARDDQDDAASVKAKQNLYICGMVKPVL